ncbi:hypothetical protein YC2023_089689 [Brassica napus]
MGAKWNSMIAIVFLVAMIMAMENISGETLPQCREDCIQGCATTGALPYQCLQSCYRGCRGLPPAIKGLAPKPERAEAKSGMQFEPHHNKALPTLHIEKSDSPPPETKWTTKDAGNTKQDTSLLKQNQNTEDQLKKREPRLADTENQCKLQCASSSTWRLFRRKVPTYFIWWLLFSSAVVD